MAEAKPAVPVAADKSGSKRNVLASGSPVALITGAAMGIGRSIAARLLDHGYRIVAVDIDEEALLRSFDGFAKDQVLTVIADIADEEQATGCVRSGIDHFGRLDGVVNSAALHGAAWNKPSLSYAPEAWQRLFAVNVFAIPVLAKAAREALSKADGVIVNISSMVGYGHGPGSAYALSKVAVNGMTMSLAKELGKDGIRVVGVAPGFIATPTVLEFLDQASLDRIEALQALPGQGAPDDVAEIVAFLLSPGARLLTGTTLHADLGIIRRL